MFKVGITGTIGSGKTTVSRIFESLGVPVYYADQEAKRILDSPLVVDRVSKTFGFDLHTPEGKIDRQKLASIVFPDESKLIMLNSIIHPMVKQDFECWQGLHHDAQYVLHEAAIMLESGFGSYFNRIIVVTAPEEIRLQRVVERDKTDLSLVKQRADKQWTEPEKLKFADFVIQNDNEHLVIPQVIEIHKEILKLL